MERLKFEGLVHEALVKIPEMFRVYLDNVDLVVEDYPDGQDLVGHIQEEEFLLLGLYEGVPITNRSDYGMILPDKITLFQKSIESICSSEEEILREIRNTLVHEVAHHFGMTDQQLDDLET